MSMRPYHFIADGYAVEDLPLDALVGPAEVVQIPEDAVHIDANILEQAGIQPGVERILFKTRNNRFWLPSSAPSFSKILLRLHPMGRDGWWSRAYAWLESITCRWRPSTIPFLPTRSCLGGRVVALEGLDLSQVPAGSYTLYCLPMKLGGSDGAPARAILIQES
jgi:arylformamidase